MSVSLSGALRLTRAYTVPCDINMMMMMMFSINSGRRSEKKLLSLLPIVA